MKIVYHISAEDTSPILTLAPGEQIRYNTDRTIARDIRAAERELRTLDQLKDPVILWTDKKRHFGRPWSFTRYTLTEDTLTVTRGLFTVRESQLMLFRVRDISRVQTLGQRMFGVGTIILDSTDADTPHLHIEKVKDHGRVMRLLTTQVDKERQRNRVRVGEYSDEERGPRPGPRPEDDELCRP